MLTLHRASKTLPRRLVWRRLWRGRRRRLRWPDRVDRVIFYLLRKPSLDSRFNIDLRLDAAMEIHQTVLG